MKTAEDYFTEKQSAGKFIGIYELKKIIAERDKEWCSRIEEKIDKHRHQILSILPEGIIEHNEHRQIVEALKELLEDK